MQHIDENIYLTFLKLKTDKLLAAYPCAINFMHLSPFLSLPIILSMVSCSGHKKKNKQKQERQQKGEPDSCQQTTTNFASASEEYSIKGTEYCANGTFRVKSIEPDKKGKKGKKSRTKQSALEETYFSVVEYKSTPSFVSDERPILRPFLTDNDAELSDFTSSSRAKALSQLPRMTKTNPKKASLPDHVAGHVDHAVMQSDFDGSYDGGICVGNTNYDPVYGKVPPPFSGERDPNCELDPFASEYIDPETSQKGLNSHIGRPIGRDGREKPFERRNSYSSINGGCAIS
jgi:hypothetical protein